MNMIVSSRLLRGLAAALIGLMLPPVWDVASADAPGADVASPKGSIKGAGATFPAPVYLEWAVAYERAGGARVSYSPVGSGEGLQQIRNHQVDFGASDAPLTSDELGAAGLMQFPVVVGGVVPVINIMGIKPGQLRLSGEVLADIYLGKVRKWNDAAIVALNPGLALPPTNITVVHRTEPSGSTLLWTDFLSRSSPQWRSTVGTSLTPQWPVGTGGTGNEGVAAYVQRTRFALGYVEYIYGRQHHLSDVALRNHDGRFVQAGREAFSSAAAAAGSGWSFNTTYQQLATDQPGAGSWPVTGASFILIAASAEHSANTVEVLRFFDWALHHGEPMVRHLDYAPVPQGVIERMPELWSGLRDPAGQPLWPDSR
jgi:phosphate transport system substrate-binding protein